MLKGDIPEILKNNKKYAVLFRQIATPNYETKRFIALAKENNLCPVIFEYHNDKFTSNNEFKHSLRTFDRLCPIPPADPINQADLYFS